MLRIQRKIWLIVHRFIVLWIFLIVANDARMRHSFLLKCVREIKKKRVVRETNDYTFGLYNTLNKNPGKCWNISPEPYCYPHKAYSLLNALLFSFTVSLFVIDIFNACCFENCSLGFYSVILLHDKFSWKAVYIHCNPFIRLFVKWWVRWAFWMKTKSIFYTKLVGI